MQTFGQAIGLVRNALLKKKYIKYSVHCRDQVLLQPNSLPDSSWIDSWSHRNSSQHVYHVQHLIMVMKVKCDVIWNLSEWWAQVKCVTSNWRIDQMSSDMTRSAVISVCLWKAASCRSVTLELQTNTYTRILTYTCI